MSKKISKEVRKTANKDSQPVAEEQDCEEAGRVAELQLKSETVKLLESRH
jgi:hypothetical protein